MYIKKHFRRIDFVVTVLLFLFLLILIKIIFIQFFRHNFLKEISLRQHNLYLELEPKRGTIYDRNLNPQAINVVTDSVYAVSRQIKDKEKTIELLAPILSLKKDTLRERIYSNKLFFWLQRKISSEEKSEINTLGLKGIEFIKESKRSYPNIFLASNIIGFAGLDNVGLEGIELYYDKYLMGKPGWAQILRDARQNLVLYENLVNPVDGYDIVLTIDEFIQFITEKELDNVYKKYRAKSASAIVMDPFTGQILAWAVRPNYDLNNPQRFSLDERRNRAITDILEPGSVFKIVTASAALEEKKFYEQDKIFCENGKYRLANHILHDHKPHGWLTFSEVFMQSSNIGVSKIAQVLGPQFIYKYIKKFGFGSKTGIDLSGEVPGVIKEPRFWSKTSIGAIPMGQEVGVTALQLCSAISVIANGGNLVKPYLVLRIQDKNQEIIQEFTPWILGRVISEDSSLRIKNILKNAVERGTGVLARLKDYTSAGKTGTAQKLEPDGSYSHNKFVASFIGFAPVDNPKVAIVITVDEPHPYYFGGVVAAPVFKNISSFAIRYLEKRAQEQLLMTYEAK